MAVVKLESRPTERTEPFRMVVRPKTRVVGKFEGQGDAVPYVVGSREDHLTVQVQMLQQVLRTKVGEQQS